MEIEIILCDEAPVAAVLAAKMRQTAEKALELDGIFSASLSISIVNDEEIRLLNKRHRRIDAATDVLSFPQYEGLEELTGLSSPELGDIVISLERAVAQAAEYGHSLVRELCFLAAHGTLHLIGYDHIDEETESKMTARQEEILGGLGICR